MRTKPLFVVFCLVLSSVIAQADEQTNATVLRERAELSSDEKRTLPKNLARWHMGSTLIETSDAGRTLGAEWALPSGPKQDLGILLSDDETESITLEAGRTVYIINFQDLELVQRFITKSFGASGQIRLLGSETLQPLDSEEWLSLGRPGDVRTNDFLELKFSPSELQYLAVIYDIETAGEVGNWGIIGDLSTFETRLPSRLENQSFAQNTAQLDDAFSFDFATLYSGTSIPFTSNKTDNAEVENMIDDDFRTYYELEPSSAPSAMLIDLNESTFVNKLSILIEAQTGTLEFYLLNEIPGSEEDTGTAFYRPGSGVFISEQWLDAKGRPLLLAQSTGPIEVTQNNSDTRMREISLYEDFFDSREARYSREIKEGDQRISIDLEAQNTRYVLLRWLPANPEPEASQSSLRIYELSVFGPMPPEEPFIERGLDFDELAPAGEVAEGAAPGAPGTPQDPAAPPPNPAPDGPLIPTVNPVSP